MSNERGLIKQMMGAAMRGLGKLYKQHVPILLKAK